MRLNPTLLASLDADARDAFWRDQVGVSARAAVAVLLTSVGAQLVQRLGGTETHVGMLRASGQVGLLLSLAWVRLGRGRSPLPLIAWPEMVSRGLLAVTGLALLGGSPASVALTFTLLAGLSQAASMLPSPFLTTVYGLVLPAPVRAQAVAIGRMTASVVGIGVAVVAGALLERHFRLWPLTFGLVGLAALVAARHATALSAPAARAPEAGGGPSFLHVLRTDRDFVRFEAFQFLLGFATLAAIPILDVFVRAELKLKLSAAVLVVGGGVIQQALSFLTVRYHGRMLDRVGVLRHRAATSVLMGLGFLAWSATSGLGMALVASVLVGLGMAGGQLIWLLSPLAFAPPGAVSTYSGIHSVVTGVRGVLAPAVGVALLRSELLDGHARPLFVAAGLLILLSALGHATLVGAPPVKPLPAH